MRAKHKRRLCPADRVFPPSPIQLSNPPILRICSSNCTALSAAHNLHHWPWEPPAASYNALFLKTRGNAETNKQNGGTALIPVPALNLCCHIEFFHYRALSALRLVTRSFYPNRLSLG